MAELRPYPFSALVRRALTELKVGDSLFDLPRRRFYRASPSHDLRATHHGFVASTPLGPAAGPHTQMAQNIALAWLGGCRIIELKTVQVNDTLVIPRPCIDMQTVGYNVEWSQELRLPQSLEEYVKGAMLIAILRASGDLEVAADDAVLFDMSVGYDLAGIRSPEVQEFIAGILDCSAIVDRLRAEIPPELRRFRDLDFPTRLADTLTLSTFHGCPPTEIEAIVSFLLDQGIHTTVKLNPTLLGPDRARALLGETLGYDELEIPDSAFIADTQWSQAVDFCGRLADRADNLGLGFGIKLTNTLIVRNHRDFFPKGEEVMYLSGQPLHVLAIDLVGRFRRTFGDRLPISFSAGIDRHNFADAVALGLCPITVCSDLLRPGGYGRASAYLGELQAAMDRLGAADLPSYILRAYGRGEAALDRLEIPAEETAAARAALARGDDLRAAAGRHFDAWVSAAILENTAVYGAACPSDPRYTAARNSRPPRKVGSHLELFDCLSCNKCVPVCPNHANFALATPPREQAILKARRGARGWELREEGTIRLEKAAQYANFADFCNDCGNCDIFCPEDGGPYRVKPRFFGSHADFVEFADLDGFFVSHGGAVIDARIAGVTYRVALAPEDPRAEGAPLVSFSGPGFAVRFDPTRPAATLTDPLEGDPAREPSASREPEIDLTPYFVIRWIRDAIVSDPAINYVRLLADANAAPPPPR